MFAALIVFFELFAHPASAQVQQESLEIHFGFDRAAPGGKEIAELMSRVQRMLSSGVPPRRVVLMGHTDSTGGDVYNDRLSITRAKNVKDLLQQLLPSDSVQIDCSGVGRSVPVHGIDSLNRTVEIHFSFEQTMPLRAYKAEAIKTIDTVFALPLISFVEDRPILTGAALMALPSYIALLKHFASDSLEVTGYYNFDGPALDSTDPRYRLSALRAKVVYDYLIDNGFDASRLSWQGKGNGRMVVSHPQTEEEMRQNIRVEITIYNYRLQ
jgi:outer membrane protein OmpA-like peptidoglycan-associated protein